jgi:hypothetical protein
MVSIVQPTYVLVEIYLKINLHKLGPFLGYNTNVSGSLCKACSHIIKNKIKVFCNNFLPSLEDD